MRGDDVCPPLEQKARDRGHDPGPVGAGDQQACGIALGAMRGGIIRLLASLLESGHAGGSYLLVLGEWTGAGVVVVEVAVNDLFAPVVPT